MKQLVGGTGKERRKGKWKLGRESEVEKAWWGIVKACRTETRGEKRGGDERKRERER